MEIIIIFWKARIFKEYNIQLPILLVSCLSALYEDYSQDWEDDSNFSWKEASTQLVGKKICTPKNEGGLGLRKLSNIAKTSLLKQVWVQLSDDSSLCSQQTRGKYLKHENFWDAKDDNNYSTA